MTVYDVDEDDAPQVRPVEPETVTLEAFLEAVRALQRIQELSALQESGYLRKAVRMALSVVTPERMICALDKAAETPEWWRVNRLHIFCPEMTQGEIAAFLKIRKQTVKHYINRVEIPADAWNGLPELPKF